MILFNSHVWHGGARNHVGGERWVVQAYFSRRAATAQLDQRLHARRETLKRLGHAARTILDVDGADAP